MKIELPKNVKTIINRLQEAGFEAYAVGGCVRDSLLGRQPQDWDITTSALPNQVKQLFKRTIDTGIQHGTVTIMLDHVGYEVTTYRIDGEYEDARHPKEVTFTSNLLEDLRRRDFTINAMAYNEETGIVDAFDGVGDLERGIIRCVGQARERFGEDALRMLRAVRFAAQLDFTIEEDTREAIRELAPSIAKVSAERIQTELNKLLASSHPGRIRDAYDLGLTAVFFPEFDRMMETPQNSLHHIYTVGEHTIVAMEHVEDDKILRLSMLFHDIAKPVCRRTDENGKDHFHGHPQVGETMTKDILKRLKYDNDTISQVCRMVLFHDERPEPTLRNVRRLTNRVGAEFMPMLFAVKRADALAQSPYKQEEKLQLIADYQTCFARIMEEKQCVQKGDLAIGGKDLIALGLKPGPGMGQTLEKIFQEVLEDPTLNQREQLLAMAKEEIACLEKEQQ